PTISSNAATTIMAATAAPAIFSALISTFQTGPAAREFGPAVAAGLVVELIPEGESAQSQ
ncbi:MAG: hypothetical protein WAV72_16440, partial [Bradyrhizobium sp.]